MRYGHVAAQAVFISLLSTTALANTDNDIKELRQEITSMKQAYESRIKDLEAKLAKMEKTNTAPQENQKNIVNTKPAVTAETTAPAPVQTASNKTKTGNPSSAFNPAIGLVLNGKYSTSSDDDSRINGFGVGEEGGHVTEGFSLGESELTFSSNVDDKFYGNLTAALASEDGQDEIEIEEAYIRNLSGIGLPAGITVTAGRALWTFGYLNEQHAHTDDFADRPLPYRVFLNNAFNDDGAEISYVLPTDLYTEIGGGMFRGDAFPGGTSKGEGAAIYSGFARVGGDIGANQSWRVGASILSGKSPERITDDSTVTFKGNSDLYGADLRYTMAPTGNAAEQEILLQAEYMWRKEEGIYNDSDAVTGDVDFDGLSSGFYVQGVYKFLPQWRVGARYSQLDAPDVPAGLIGSGLDANGHTPKNYAIMGDWSNTEFSRIRLQYNNEEVNSGKTDNRVMLQYIMSLGAHGSHKY